MKIITILRTLFLIGAVLGALFLGSKAFAETAYSETKQEWVKIKFVSGKINKITHKGKDVTKRIQPVTTSNGTVIYVLKREK